MTTHWLKVADELRAARDLIRRPEAWTKRASARSTAGKPVWPWDRDAVSWCALGALHRQMTAPYSSILLCAALPSRWRGSTTAFNDDSATTHRMVMLLFGRAIKWAEKQPTP
jgi:hypothetical protein